MENTTHTMQDLFQQLGLPDDDAAIAQFIARQRPLAPQLRLFDAPIWSVSQAAFLRDKLREDGDWSMLIDELDARLRDHPAADDLEQVAHEPAMQGEGNIAAARRYDEKAQAFAESGRVGPAARSAAPQSAEEAAEMREAEAVGLSKARA